MATAEQNEEEFVDMSFEMSPLSALGARMAIALFESVKDYTVRELIEMAAPKLIGFAQGYAIGLGAEFADDEDEDEDEPAEASPSPRAAPRTPRKKKVPPAPRKKTPKAKANGKAPADPSQLTQHLQTILKAATSPMKAPDILAVLPGVSAPQLRRALNRLVEDGAVVAEGNTRSRTYIGA